MNFTNEVGRSGVTNNNVHSLQLPTDNIPNNPLYRLGVLIFKKIAEIFHRQEEGSGERAMRRNEITSFSTTRSLSSVENEAVTSLSAPLIDRIGEISKEKIIVNDLDQANVVEGVVLELNTDMPSEIVMGIPLFPYEKGGYYIPASSDGDKLTTPPAFEIQRATAPPPSEIQRATAPPVSAFQRATAPPPDDD